MNENDIHLKLLANVPIDIDGIGQFQLPTIREIISMGESKHQQYLSMVLFSKDYVNADNLDDYSDYEVLATSIFYDPIFYELVANSFRLFLGKDIRVEQIDDKFALLFDDSVLTEENWEFIKKVARMGNFVEEKKEDLDKYKAGNERARKFMEKLKQKKAEAEAVKKKVEKINLRSILSAVSWRTNGIDSLLDKTIYQLYDGYFRLGLIDNYNQITTGIYTGNVDGSKIKLPDINWANIIKIN